MKRSWGWGAHGQSASRGTAGQRRSLAGSCCQLGPDRQVVSSSCLCRWLLSSSEGGDPMAVLATDPTIRQNPVCHFLVPRCTHLDATAPVLLPRHDRGGDTPGQGTEQTHSPSPYTAPCSAQMGLFCPQLWVWFTYVLQRPGLISWLSQPRFSSAPSQLRSQGRSLPLCSIQPAHPGHGFVFASWAQSTSTSTEKIL